MTAYRKATVTDVSPQSWTLPDSDPHELDVFGPRLPRSITVRKRPEFVAGWTIIRMRLAIYERFT
jgi:hypothetical protein